MSPVGPDPGHCCGWYYNAIQLHVDLNKVCLLSNRSIYWITHALQAEMCVLTLPLDTARC